MSVTREILTPTVVAAVVSAAALIAREVVASASRKAESRRQSSLQARQARRGRKTDHRRDLLEQVQLLWSQNARLKRRERALEQRCSALSRRCSQLERTCQQLRLRLDELSRLLVRGRAGSQAVQKPIPSSKEMTP